MAAVDWSLLFFDPDNGLPDKLMARARRRFGDSPDADAAYNYALDQLSEDDWAGLSARYTGRGSPAGFLAITFINALEDYARQKYPRARPPQWLRRLGDLWLQVWQRLCLKRDAVETIVGALDDGDRDRGEEIRRATVEIKARVPNCGVVVSETAAGDSDDPPDFQTPDDTASDREMAGVLLSVGAAALGRETPGALTDDRLSALRDALALNDLDRLLLKLVYDDGHTVAAAARMLDLTRKQASRRHLAVLEQLRKALAPLGLSE